MTKKMKIPTELEGEYTIRVVDMPLTSPGFVMYDNDDHANIYLNAHYNRETNENTADHEMVHVINDDIHNDDPIELVEARAAGIPITLRAIPRLMKACDLLPKPKPKPQPVPKTRTMLSPHQAAVLLRAITDLDSMFFNSKYDF